MYSKSKRVGDDKSVGIYELPDSSFIVYGCTIQPENPYANNEKQEIRFSKEAIHKLAEVFADFVKITD